MSRHTGFGLIELMVTLAITAIILSVAAPSFKDFRISSQIQALSSDFSSDLAIARSEAARRGVSMIMCASSDNSSCGGSWQDGWIVGQNSGGSAVVAGSVVRAHDALPKDYTLAPNGNVPALVFAPTGNVTTAMPTSGATAGTLIWTVCYPGKKGRDLAVNLAGRVTITKPTCP